MSVVPRPDSLRGGRYIASLVSTCSAESEGSLGVSSMWLVPKEHAPEFAELASARMAAVKQRFSFLCGSRGYHECRTIWTPNVILAVQHELSNLHDQYAIALKTEQ